MTSKLPWVAAALIMAAAVGVWAIYGGAPPTTPTPTGAWNQTETWTGGTGTAAVPGTTMWTGTATAANAAWNQVESWTGTG